MGAPSYAVRMCGMKDIFEETCFSAVVFRSTSPRTGRRWVSPVSFHVSVDVIYQSVVVGGIWLLGWMRRTKESSGERPEPELSAEVELSRCLSAERERERERSGLVDGRRRGLHRAWRRRSVGRVITGRCINRPTERRGAVGISASRNCDGTGSAASPTRLTRV